MPLGLWIYDRHVCLAGLRTSPRGIAYLLAEASALLTVPRLLGGKGGGDGLYTAICGARAPEIVTALPSIRRRPSATSRSAIVLTGCAPRGRDWRRAQARARQADCG